jgi:hypothetical protein
MDTNIYHDLASPQKMTLRRLVALTRDYYRLSAANVDKPQSKVHRFYYVCANECERRGLDLDRVITASPSRQKAS